MSNSFHLQPEPTVSEHRFQCLRERKDRRREEPRMREKGRREGRKIREGRSTPSCLGEAGNNNCSITIKISG